MDEKTFYGQLAFDMGKGFVDTLIELLITTEGFDEERALAFAKRFTVIWATAFAQAAGDIKAQEAD